MKTTQKTLSTLTLLFLTIHILFAQMTGSVNSFNEKAKKDQFKQAINVCPIAPIFGIYALNYEYMVSPRSGILVRIEYEDVPNTYTDANIESSGWAYSINYRRHLSEGLHSFFLGAFSRYRIYNGEGFIENDAFDFELSSMTIGLNAGKRWVWNSGFDITISMGYGANIKDRESSKSSTLIESSLDQLEDEYDFMTPLYGEISAGYAF